MSIVPSSRDIIEHDLVAFVGQDTLGNDRLVGLAQMKSVSFVLTDASVQAELRRTDVQHTTRARRSVHSARGQWIPGVLNRLQALLASKPHVPT